HRRFFTVTELVGIRQEIPEVFDDTHALVRELIADGTVDGLRIDHIDGLRDPEGYLARLAEASGRAYVVVEKILGAGEELPASWVVAGTTGYEYLEASGRLFVDPEGHQDLLDHYGELTGALT